MALARSVRPARRHQPIGYHFHATREPLVAIALREKAVADVRRPAHVTGADDAPDRNHHADGSDDRAYRRDQRLGVGGSRRTGRAGGRL